MKMNEFKIIVNGLKIIVVGSFIKYANSKKKIEIIMDSARANPQYISAYIYR